MSLRDLRPTLRARSVLLVLALVLPAAPALALTASCQAELDKHGTARLEVIKRINAFGKRRMTPQQACSTFSELVKVEAGMLKWMEGNQDWCQLPEAFVQDFKKNTPTSVKIRGQACTAVKKQAQMRAQQNAAPRGPAPGSGISLPKGAL